MNLAADRTVPQSMLAVARVVTWSACGLLLYGIADWTMARPWFALTRIDVATPVAHVTAAQLQLVAERRVRGSFFTVDLDHVRDSLEKLPWVAEARVERRWPDTLVVALTEHQPLARWNDGALVSTTGATFVAASDADLPRFYGPAQQAAEVVAAYRRYSALLQPLRQRISELELSPRGAWALTLDSGVKVQLGRVETDRRLARFAALYPQIFAAGAVAPRTVDLRYPDGFAVRPAQDQPLFQTPPRIVAAPSLSTP